MSVATGFVDRIVRREGVRQFVKFGIVGASGFLVNLLVFTILQHYTPLDKRAARFSLLYSAGFLAGGVSNYFLNRIWTFRATGDAFIQGVQFLSVSIIALLTGLFVAHFAQPYIGTGHKAWFLATVSGIVVNFFINKYWTFRPTADL
ncbi:MAG TPA: GtrA family protein [Candidatus Baltobacteraceae bacterium]